MILRFLWKALLVVVLVLVLISKAQPCLVPAIRDKTGNVIKVVDVIAGKDVRLTCNVKENGAITSWLKNNKTISPSDHPRMRLTLNKYLKIKKTEKADAGFYTCVAENDCVRNVYSMQLFVGSPTRNPHGNSTPAVPKFTVPPDRLSRNLLALPVGNSVKLDCSADGYPRPTVRWYKDGALFQERKQTQTGSRLYLGPRTLLLNMRDLVPTDSGKYTCNVSNAYGWINHTYYVDVHGMPTVIAHKEEKSGNKSSRASRIQYPEILIGMLVGVVVLAIIASGFVLLAGQECSGVVVDSEESQT